jgi:hypothetical protein
LAPWRLGGSIFLFLLFVTPAFAASLAGDWYGEGYQPLWHEDAQWLMHLAPDGGYAIDFRRYHNCALTLEQKERGTWSLGSGFRTLTTEVNGRATRYENDYRIGPITEREFRITHTATGQQYTERRVAPDFTMPAPTCPTS